jgi:hypothetical protein
LLALLLTSLIHESEGRKLRININAGSQEELDRRIKDNEKRGWTLVVAKDISQTVSNWDLPLTSFRNSKKTRLSNNFIGSTDHKRFKAVMKK